MRSQLAERLGVQIPQIIHQPPDVVSLVAAEEAIDLADAYGLADGHPLDESQRITLRAAMGERADGSWAATSVADFGGRQGAGKSVAIEAREFYGLRVLEEPLLIHTAHEFPTANESFLRLVAVFENWDDLRAKVRRVLYGNGTQSIVMRSGSRILYKARTAGAGRGFSKAALVVYDEAQHLQPEHVAASGPTKLAHPNSQSWYAGSGGFEHSALAHRLRRRALSGAGGRLAYVEKTAERVSFTSDGQIDSVRPDPYDRDGWAMANPGLGRWVDEETLAGLLDELGPELFARECLCVWDPELTDTGSLSPAWSSLVDVESKIASHPQIALDVSADRRSASFGTAGRRADGKFHVEAWPDRPGTDWIVDVAVSSWELRRIPIRIQTGSPAGALIGPLRERGVEVVEVSAVDHAQALGQFLDACANGGLRHRDAPSLNAAVRGAVLRRSGEVDVLARRASRLDICPLVAVTLALGGVPGARKVDVTANVW